MSSSEYDKNNNYSTELTRLDFVVVGPMKTGTSWIHSYLDSHSGVSVPTKVKETFYFTRNYSKGEQWFASQFSDNKHEKVIQGEIGPTYFAESSSVDRIMERSPNCQILVVLREPIERVISHYRHLIRSGRIPAGTPVDVAFTENQRLFEHSLYYKNSRSWIAAFGTQNVALLTYEELAQDPERFAENLCRQLGIAHMPIPEHLKKRVGEGRKPKSKALVRFATRAKKRLRKLELHRLVNLGKSIGLRKLLYHRESDHTAPAEIDGIAEAFAMIEEDVANLDSLGFDTSQWKSRWIDLDLVHRQNTGAL